MLNDDDRNYVTEKTAEFLAPRDNPRLILSSRLPIDCMELIGYHQYSLGYALEAVKVCIESRWRYDPSWLYRLLQLLPPEPRTGALMARISVPPVTTNAVNARVLATDSPFLNRQLLRTKLSVLQKEEPLPKRPVLVVNGGPKTGKTYSTEYLTHLTLAGMAYDICHVTFPAKNGFTFGPEQLAEQMLIGMGVALHKLSATFLVNTTNSERWAQDLAGRVLSEGAVNGRSFWIVLDGFTASDLREDTRNFITGLAAHIIQNSIFRRKYRLILLGFERSYFTVQPGQVDLEEIHPAGETDVLQWLEELFAREGRSTQREDIEPFLTRIMQGLPTDERRMVELNQRLVDLMKTLGGSDA